MMIYGNYFLENGDKNMHEDLKILCYGDVLKITLPINETTIERAIAIIKERGLTKLSIVRNSPQAPTYSLKFLNDFTEATKITSLKLYAYFYDFDLYGVADIYDVLNLFNTLVGKLGNVNTAVLAGCELNKRARRYNSDYRTDIHIADLRVAR